jgi:hypothetical protein
MEMLRTAILRQMSRLWCPIRMIYPSLTEEEQVLNLQPICRRSDHACKTRVEQRKIAKKMKMYLSLAHSVGKDVLVKQKVLQQL